MAKLSLTDITTGYFSAAAYNANNALIEAALENTLSRDGTTPNTLSAALDMNSNKINNLTDGTNNQDAITKIQLDTAIAAVVAGAGGLTNIVEDLTPQLGGVLDSNDFGINFTSASYLFTMEADETNGWLSINADTPWTNEWGLNLAVGGWFSMQSGADVYTTLETTPILGDTLYNQLLYNSTNGTGYLAEFSYNGDTFLQLGSYVQDAPMGFYVTQGSATGYKYPMVFDAENGYTYFGQFPVRIGNLGNTWENVSAPYNLTAPINYPTAYVEHGHDGADFNVTGVNTLHYDLIDFSKIQVRDGAGLWIWDALDTDAISITHNGTDAIINGTLTTNLNFTGFDALDVSAKILLPQENTPTAPTLAFGDGDTGFYESADDVISVAVTGNDRYVFQGSRFESATVGGGFLVDEAATATNPTMGPRNTDFDTGLGSNAADQVSIIAGGLEVARATETAAAGQFIVDPGVTASAAAPSLAFGDGDTGFYESADDTLRVIVGGALKWLILGNYIQSADASGCALLNETPSATNPVILPNKADTDTGLGQNAVDQLSLVTGGVEGVRITESAGLISTDMTGDVSGNFITPVNGQAANYTMLLSDAGKTIRFTGATAAQTYTIPANASVAYPIGTMIGIENDGTVSISLAITTDTLTWSKDNTTGTRTLAAGASAVIKKTTATTWKISGSALVS